MADFSTKLGQRSVSPVKIIFGRNTRKRAPDLQGENQPLYRAKASWLSGLFPDELIVQEKSITIVHNGFLSSNDETMPIKDIGKVIAENTALLSTLRILGKNPSQIVEIQGLGSRDAERCKESIEGLLLASVEQPDEAGKSAVAASIIPESGHSHMP